MVGRNDGEGEHEMSDEDHNELSSDAVDALLDEILSAASEGDLFSVVARPDESKIGAANGHPWTVDRFNNVVMIHYVDSAGFVFDLRVIAPDEAKAHDEFFATSSGLSEVIESRWGRSDEPVRDSGTIQICGAAYPWGGAECGLASDHDDVEHVGTYSRGVKRWPVDPMFIAFNADDAFEPGSRQWWLGRARAILLVARSRRLRTEPGITAWALINAANCRRAACGVDLLPTPDRPQRALPSRAARKHARRLNVAPAPVDG